MGTVIRPSRSLWLYVPPPLLFVATFMLGVQLARLLPGATLPLSITPVVHVLGTAGIVAAALLIISAPGLFLMHRTTIVPHGTSRTLITGGPFRLSRNPMYLALVSAYVGAALALNVLWPLALVALPVWIMHTKVIPCEECALTESFGDEYRAYQRRVRRWI